LHASVRAVNLGGMGLIPSADDVVRAIDGLPQ